MILSALRLLASAKVAVFSVMMIGALAGSMMFCGQVLAADDIIGEACQSAPDSTACKDRVGSADPSPLTGTNGVLYRASQIVAAVAGIVAVIMLIIAGFRYINSAGDAQKAGEAKKTIIGAIVGLIIIIAAQSIITLVVKEIR